MRAPCLAFARRALPASFGVAVLFSAACVAAVASHYAIDALGDFALPHDTYDHIGHVSRPIAALFAAVFALVGAALVLGAAFADARRFRGAFGAILGARGLRSPLRVVASIVPTAIAILVAMESIDGRIATGIQPDLAASLGGSIALGAATVVAIATAVAIALWRGVRALFASRHRIAAALWRLAGRGADPSSVASRTSHTAPPDAAGAGSVLSRRAGKRAPPIAA